MCSIVIETIDDAIADYHFLRKRIIRDKRPLRKRGVSGYRIECYKWYGKNEFLAIIDASWLCETIKAFDTLRDASDWIKERMH